jgi:hypothetical protein
MRGKKRQKAGNTSQCEGPAHDEGKIAGDHNQRIILKHDVSSCGKTAKDTNPFPR